MAPTIASPRSVVWARELDPAVLPRLQSAFREELSAIARQRDLTFEFTVLSETKPAYCDEGVFLHELAQ